MSKKKFNLSTFFLTILLLTGISIMLYPIISNWWNSKVQSHAVAGYAKTIAELDNGESEKIIAKAKEYNRKLSELSSPFSDCKEIDGYDEILDVSGTGIMGYITIPVIKVELPIYHGTSDEVLNIAAGHLEGSAFPVGGENTHCVISAHRGLPSAKLFSDLDELTAGDVFTVTVLDEILTYEVEEIFIVEPDEVQKINIIPEGDYLTLMTCTPYGINTHRLLVRSKRIETVYKSNVNVTADAVQVDSLIVVPLIFFPLLLGLVGYWILSSKNKKESVQDIIRKMTSEKD